MLYNATTERLSLHPLSTNDAVFIEALVNTPDWLKFIGDRHVKNKEISVGDDTLMLYGMRFI